MAARESRREHWETFWDAKQEVHEVYSNAGRVGDQLTKLLDLRGKRVLEIGAGTGRDSSPLVAAGASVTQLDYAENSLRLMKRIAAQEGLHLNIIGGDTFALPFRDGTFDVVFHQGLLEHFRKPEALRLLEENVRVLRPGGLLIVDVPQRYHVYTVVKHLLIAVNRWFAGWERSFSIGELTDVMQSVGLEPVHRYGVWMYPSFFYRSLREVLKGGLGLRLPLYPKTFRFLTTVRAAVRQRLLATSLPLYTGIAVGVAGRKASTPA